MEITVNVLGLRGGEDVTIHIELRLTEREEKLNLADELDWFSSNQVQEWAMSQGLPKGQASAAFHFLYLAALDGQMSSVRTQCSLSTCRRRACRGVHLINRADFLGIRSSFLGNLTGIGAQRHDLVVKFQQDLAGR